MGYRRRRMELGDLPVRWAASLTVRNVGMARRGESCPPAYHGGRGWQGIPAEGSARQYREGAGTVAPEPCTSFQQGPCGYQRERWREGVGILARWFQTVRRN